MLCGLMLIGHIKFGRFCMMGAFIKWYLFLVKLNKGGIMKIKNFVKLYGPLVLWIIISNLVLSVFFWYFCKMADNAWDVRACNAGYYNTMPEDLKNPNFKCDK